MKKHSNARAGRAAAIAAAAVVAILLTPGGANSAPSNSIGEAGRYAAPGYTTLLAGDFDNSSDVYVTDTDGISTAATILHRSASMIQITIPATAKNGRLRVYVEDGPNTLTLNAPELDFCIFDEVSTGATMDVFGSRLGDPGTTWTVEVDNGAGTTASAVLTAVNEVHGQLTVGDWANGDWTIWVDEPDWAWIDQDYGGPSTFTVVSPWTLPAGTFDVTAYGAVPDDGNVDTTPVQAAIVACNAAGGGSVYFPAGRYEIDDSVEMIPASGVILRLYDDVWLVGESSRTTVLALVATNNDNYSMVSGNGDHTGIDQLELEFATGATGNIGLFGCGDYMVVRDVVCDLDATTKLVTLATGWPVHHVLWDRVEIYSGMSLRVDGEQIHYRDVTHFGPREITWYTDAGASIEDDFANGMIAYGGWHVWLERVNVTPRWPTKDRSHFRRFLSATGSSYGLDGYVLEGCYGELNCRPYAGVGECILVSETSGWKYHGPVASMSGNQVTLTSAATTDSKTIDWTTYPPLYCFAAQGSGFGQVLPARLNSDGLTVALLETPTIPFDATTTVVLAWSAADWKIVDSEMVTSSPFNSTGTGLNWYGHAFNNTVTSSTFTNWHTGAIVFGLNSRNAIYWNTIKDCDFIDCTVPFAWDPDDITAYVVTSQTLAMQVIDNLLDGRDGCPNWTYWPAGISVDDQVGEAHWEGNRNISPIFEGNTITDTIAGVRIEPYTVWPVVRLNTIKATSDSLQINSGITDATVADNLTSTVPYIYVTAWAPGVTGTMERRPSYDASRIQQYGALGILCEDGTGSVIIASHDDDGDFPTTITVAADDMSWTTPTLSWTGLSAGLYHGTLTIQDPETDPPRHVDVYLCVSTDADGFSSVSAVVQGDGYQIRSDDRYYLTDEITAYDAAAAHTVNVASNRVLITPVYQWLRLGPKTTNGLSHNSALLTAERMIRQYRQGISTRWRLYESSDTYYEALIPWDMDVNLLALRYIKKIVAGSVVDSTIDTMAHRTDDRVIFVAENGNVNLYAFGTTTTLTDSSPLSIETWSIDIDANSLGGATTYEIFDNLGYAEWSPVYGSGLTHERRTSATVPCYVVPAIYWEIESDSGGAYDETSTLTIAGDVHSIKITPDATAAPDANWQTSLLYGTDELLTSGTATPGWITVGATGGVSSAWNASTSGTVRLRASGMGAGKKAVVEIRYWDGDG